MKTKRTPTKDKTMRGRVFFDNHESELASASQRFVRSASNAIRSEVTRRSSSKRSSADMFGSMSTRFLTTPKTPESGSTSPTASRMAGALVVNHAPTFVSRSRRLSLEGVNGAKVYFA